MKIKELRQKTNKEMKDLLNEKQEKLGRLKFGSATKKIKNVKEIQKVRRTVARILTVLNEDKGNN